jgi:DNA topoisomerase-2
LISELPVKKWTQDYKEALEKMLVPDGKAPPELQDFRENHTDTTVSFTLTAEKSKIDEWEKAKDGLMGKFKLIGSLSETNMVLFDKEGSLVKYETTTDILKTFYDVRIEFYHKRKDLLMNKLEREQRMLANKARFVEEVCSGSLEVSNRRRKDLLHDLQERGYETFTSNDKAGGADAEEEDDDMEQSESELAKGYEYLLGMKIWSLTMEKVEALKAQLAEKTDELENLRDTSPSQLWLNDLDAIENALDDRDAGLAAAADDERRAQVKNTKHRAKMNKKLAVSKKKKKKDEWESDLESSSDDDDKMNLDSDDDEGFQPVARKPAPRTKPVVKSKVSVKAVPAMKPKPVAGIAAAVAKPVPVPKAAEPPKKLAEPIDVDSDSDYSTCLMDRIKKIHVSPPGKLMKNAVSQSKRPSPKMAETESLSDKDVDESFEEQDEDVYVEASVTPKKKSAKVTQPAKRVRKKEEVPAKAAPKAKAAAKKKPSFDDSDSDLDFNAPSDDEVVAKKPAAARGQRAARAAKPTTYVLEDSDDESAEPSSDSDSDGDF